MTDHPARARLDDLPPGLAAALNRVWAVLPEARLVGGAVRDLAAGRPVVDLDLATSRPPQAVIAAIEAAGLTAIPTGLAHGTVSAMVGAERVEITTLRRDVDTDGRHATVAWTDDWHEDAARRDFTFNAMSLGRDGVLHDDFGGLDDLRAGRVRFVGDPALRIAEDRLRVLRYFRFLARFGHAPPDAAAIAAIAAGTAGLGRLSAERVWSELRRLFDSPSIAAVVALMARLGVFAALLGDDVRDGGAELLLRLEASGAGPDALLRLAALTRPGRAEALADRLRLSRAERAMLAGLLAGEALPPDADDDALRAARDAEPADILSGRIWLDQATRLGAPDPARDGLRARLAGLPQPVFPLHGTDVLAAGLAPGPQVGAILEQVRAWWRGQGCRPDRGDCLAELGRLL